jgi:hypothetical protein
LALRQKEITEFRPWPQPPSSASKDPSEKTLPQCWALAMTRGTSYRSFGVRSHIAGDRFLRFVIFQANYVSMRMQFRALDALTKT